jgi:hypothetical protein
MCQAADPTAAARHFQTIRTFGRWDCINARQRERAKESRFAAGASLLTSPATRRLPPKCGAFRLQPRGSPLRQTGCWRKPDSNSRSHMRWPPFRHRLSETRRRTQKPIIRGFQEKGPASPQGSSFRYRRGGPPISCIGAPWLTTATLRVGSKDLVDTGYSRLNSGTAKSRRLASESSSAVIGRGHLRIVGALLDLRGQASLG